MKEAKRFEIEDLRHGREGIYVHQGWAGISKKGEILDSSGFSRCVGLLIFNESTNEAYFAHVDRWFLNENQKEVLQGLSPGEYRVIIIEGPLGFTTSGSISNTKICDFTEVFKNDGKRKISAIEEVFVDSRDSFWAASYDPVSRKLKTYARKSEMVAEYDLRTSAD